MKSHLRVHVGDFTPRKSKCEFFVLQHQGEASAMGIRENGSGAPIQQLAITRNVFYGESTEDLEAALSRAMEEFDFLEKIEIVAQENFPILENVVEFMREQNPKKRIELFYIGRRVNEDVTEMVDRVVLYDSMGELKNSGFLLDQASSPRK